MIPRKILAVGSLLAALAISLPGAIHAAGKSATLRGYVLDSACAFTKNLKKPVSPECAVACAKAGSPLVILTDNGILYWPISRSTPATSQNDRLIEFAGKRVAVKGEVFEKGGSHAVIIEKIEVAPPAR